MSNVENGGGSEERAAWVRSNVQQFGSSSPTAAYRKLADANGWSLTILRAAELSAERTAPLG